MGDGPRGRLVGRERALGRASSVIDAARQGAGEVLLVSGVGGMGKTALLRSAVADADGVTVTWGTGVDGGSAPGYWPWTQALNGLVRQVGVEPARAAAGTDLGLVATLAPALGQQVPAEQSERGRMLLLDATVGWLQELGSRQPLVVVLDDLQWMDDSSLTLLELLVRSPLPAPLSILGAFRHDEGTPGTRRRLTGLVERTDHVHLTGLDRASVSQLCATVTGHTFTDAQVDDLFRRAGGHPFFTRELALATLDDGSGAEIPLAVRDAVGRRVARFDPITRELLRTAALAGPVLLPDVLTEVTGRGATEVESAVVDGVSAGMLRPPADGGDGATFAHDLFRETLVESIPAGDRAALHLGLGRALAARAGRASGVPAADVSRHFLAALGHGGLDDAVSWTMRAVHDDRSSLALTEAAERLRRLRTVVADAGLELDVGTVLTLGLTEADVLARSGDTPQARDLLRDLRSLAESADDAHGAARAVLAAAALGSRFATRRDELIDGLRTALGAVDDTDLEMQARLTAALARELSHSVAEQRGQAGPLTERALALGRASRDDDILADCLLARHDALWTPGQADPRAEVTAELVSLARRSEDRERLAQALLLHANVLLECGRSGFDAAASECLDLFEELGQLRHRYTLETRRACLALLRGRLDEASRRIADAAALGHRLREPDAENVRMSQQLELVRSRGRRDELTAYADEAVAHWTGAPVHAHAVAAGFRARAGDLAGARRHLAVVRDLGGWRVDRSYLWSVFVRELAVAATVLDDRPLCVDLLSEVEPLADSCGVNGAMVAFAGCHAHTAGRLQAAVGDRERARRLLEDACAVYERLGAQLHLVEAMTDLDGLPAAPSPALDRAAMDLRHGVWRLTFGGRSASVADCKGLHDVATLVARPGADVHALDLVKSPVREDAAGSLLDRTAADQYRRRLRELAEERQEAEALGDEGRLGSIDEEHEALVAELRGGTGPGGRDREFANHPAERARKAVTGRIRDAVRRVNDAFPELGAHLDQNIETGVRCRYLGDRQWVVTTERE